MRQITLCSVIVQGKGLKGGLASHLTQLFDLPNTIDADAVPLEEMKSYAERYGKNGLLLLTESAQLSRQLIPVFSAILYEFREGHLWCRTYNLEKFT